MKASRTRQKSFRETGGVSVLGRRDRWSTTAVYGAAHYGKSLFWYGGEVLFAFFLTEVAGLTPAHMAGVLAIGFLISAIFDLQAGRILFRRSAGMRRAAGLQSLGAIFSGVALVGVVATALLPFPMRVGWALTTGVLFRLAFAVYDVSQNSLMANATAEVEARSRVAVTRIFASGLGNLSVAVVVGPLIAAERRGGGGVMLIALALIAALIAITTAILLNRRLRGPTDTADLHVQSPLKRSGLGLAALWPLFAMMVLMMLGPSLFQKLEPYFATRAFASSTTGGALIIAAAAGVCCGQPLWLMIFPPSRRIALFTVSALLQAAGAVVFLLAPFDAPIAFIAGAWLFGLGNGGLGMAKWASFSDWASRLPAHRQGLAFAIFSALAKITLAVGVLIVAAAIHPGVTPEGLRGFMAAGPVLTSIGMIILARRAAPRETGDTLASETMGASPPRTS